uniref:Oviductal glycoprotein 1 n=1 Tax=Gadus morhua TaxID=8049 RepID=A0A8C5A4D3_GADMO
MNSVWAYAIVGLHLFIRSATANKLVCYFTKWSQYRTGVGRYLPGDIDPWLCTHLVYAFAVVNYANEITENEWKEHTLYRQFNELKNSNPQLKTLLSVRDDSQGAQFSSMLSSEASRQSFIRSTISFLRAHGFDGLDLDRPFPVSGGSSAQDKIRFSLLSKELLESYKAEGQGRPRLLLSAAVTADTDAIDLGYEIPEISKYLDFISVKTHDFWRGPDRGTYHHSPLFCDSLDKNTSVDYVMQYWITRGAPAQKLLLGLASHGRSFTLTSAATGKGAPVRGPGMPGPYTQQLRIWSYYEICLFLRGALVSWIDGQSVPYAVKGGEWVGFDNQDSYDAKVGYLKNRSFGGVALWTLDMDDFTGQFCGLGKYPLVSHLKRMLNIEPQYPIAVVTPLPHQHCSQNNTVAYQRDGFCSRKLDGLYLRSENPKTFYRCLLRHTYVTRCHTDAQANNRGGVIMARGGVALARVAEAALLHMFFVWSPW